jgi:methyl-accepting chemotaxis protein
MSVFQTLNAKLSLYFIVLITMILILFGIYNYLSLESNLNNALKVQAQGTLDRLSRNLPDPIWNFSERSYQQIIEAEMKTSAVQSIIVWSDGGLVVARGRNLDNEVIEVEDVPAEDSYSLKRGKDLVFNVDGKTKNIGKVDLYLNNKHIVLLLKENLIKQIIQIVLLDLILAVFQSFVLARLVGKALSEVNAAVKDIAEGDGDLRQRLDTKSKDELGTLAKAFNKFIQGIQDIIKQVMLCSHELSNSSEQSSKDTDKTRTDLDRQRLEISSLATAVNEMAASAQEVAKNAGVAAKSTMAAYEESMNGKELVDKTVVSIHALANEVQNTADEIHRLEQHSEEIGTILDVIRGIAEQTNLLALNAAIEAARAGEQGRGFAVVADEVRTLAQKTQQSTEEIQDMITQLQNGAKKAVVAMDTGKKQANNSVEKATIAGGSLENISSSVSLVANMSTHIATAAEEQHKVTTEIDKKIVNIIQVIDGTVKITQSSAQGVDKLSQLASSLESLVGKFKV